MVALRTEDKPKIRIGNPEGLSLALWRVWVDQDNPTERYSNGEWNRVDQLKRNVR